MKSFSANHKQSFNKRIFVFLLPLALALVSAASGQDNRGKGSEGIDSRLDLLNRLENGETVTAGEIKSSLHNYSIRDKEGGKKEWDYLVEKDWIIDLPSWPDLNSLRGLVPFTFRDDYLPDIDTDCFNGLLKPDGEEAKRIREEFSRAVEEAKERMREFRENDMERILDEMKRATEEMRRENDRIREEIRRHRQEHKADPVSGFKTVLLQAVIASGTGRSRV